MNGHHQHNGVENMTLFEVVKAGKSATQVRAWLLVCEKICITVFDSEHECCNISNAK